MNHTEWVERGQRLKASPRMRGAFPAHKDAMGTVVRSPRESGYAAIQIDGQKSNSVWSLLFWKKP